MVAFAFERPVVSEIHAGLGSGKKRLHVMTGPRQAGKTTAALQVVDKWRGPSIVASADVSLPPNLQWIEAHWDQASRRAVQSNQEVLLVFDEVQRINGWEEVVKWCWEKECLEPKGVQVILLGSSSTLISQHLLQSLRGQLAFYACNHWGYSEMAEAFSWDLDRWLYFGGYPGSAPFIEQDAVWCGYITDSLTNTALAKDVLELQTVAKSALLRNLFLHTLVHPARVVSYNKMMGKLPYAGNTTTLAHYLELLESAYLISGLKAFKAGKVAKRGSSPKLVIWNNALVSAVAGLPFEKARENFAWWAQLIENAVGAHLLQHLNRFPYQLYYWRHRGAEVDFVVQTPNRIWAIEVKSGKERKSGGLISFRSQYPGMNHLIIGPGHLELEYFFRTDPKQFLVE